MDGVTEVIAALADSPVVVSNASLALLPRKLQVFLDESILCAVEGFCTVDIERGYARSLLLQLISWLRVYRRRHFRWGHAILARQLNTHTHTKQRHSKLTGQVKKAASN